MSRRPPDTSEHRCSACGAHWSGAHVCPRGGHRGVAGKAPGVPLFDVLLETKLARERRCRLASARRARRMVAALRSRLSTAFADGFVAGAEGNPERQAIAHESVASLFVKGGRS
jgi:hypothetical protein